jgi:C4-dicarboxylate-specific signal transduction histidine kinase
VSRGGVASGADRAIVELAGSIVHEVSQPLGAISSSADACMRWLDRNPPSIADAREAIENIRTDVKRAADMIKGLRALARKSDFEPVQVEINDAISEALALLRNDLERCSVELRVEFFSEKRAVLGDRIQLQQVLVNLVRNGIEAMNTVTDRARVVAVVTAIDGDEAVISVEDAGIGMDQQISERMCEPLLTTKIEGMGMGLFICRSIVEAHRGKLSGARAHPHGTIMRFTVPLAEAR